MMICGVNVALLDDLLRDGLISPSEYVCAMNGLGLTLPRPGDVTMVQTKSLKDTTTVTSTDPARGWTLNIGIEEINKIWSRIENRAPLTAEQVRRAVSDRMTYDEMRCTV